MILNAEGSEDIGEPFPLIVTRKTCKLLSKQNYAILDDADEEVVIFRGICRTVAFSEN